MILIDDVDLYENVLGALFGIGDQHIEILVIVKNPGVQYFILRIVLSALLVFCS